MIGGRGGGWFRQPGKALESAAGGAGSLLVHRALTLFYTVRSPPGGAAAMSGGNLIGAPRWLVQEPAPG